MSNGMDWSLYPNFARFEFECRHSGLCDMQPEFMERLQALRTEYAKPMQINSGYRHWTHPVEAKKGHRNGEHVQGMSADIGIANPDAYRLLALAVKHGFTRIGVSQSGKGGRFIHLGLGAAGLPEPALWSY